MRGRSLGRVRPLGVGRIFSLLVKNHPFESKKGVHQDAFFMLLEIKTPSLL